MLLPVDEITAIRLSLKHITHSAVNPDTEVTKIIKYGWITLGKKFQFRKRVKRTMVGEGAGLTDTWI